MKIGGLNKLTLLDYPTKVACTVFTVGCNFRCPFCHNASLVDGRNVEYTDEKTLFEFLEKRRNVLEGVCLTGGEPLLQTGVEDFLTRVKNLGYSVKLDTNGSFPERLEELVKKGVVNYVAMDIKNSPQMYAATIGMSGEERSRDFGARNSHEIDGISAKSPVGTAKPDKNPAFCGAFDLSAICKSVEFLKSGAVDYEFRTTVTGNFHSEQSIAEMGEWLAGAKRLFLQKFVNSGDLVGSALGINPAVFACDDDAMRRFRDILRRFVPETHLRGMDDYE